MPQSVSWPFQRAVFTALFSVCLLYPDYVVAARKESSSHAAQPAVRAAPDPDAMLIGVYQDLANMHLNAAMQKADALVAAYPNFHLGHLIRGDLLLMKTSPVPTLGAAAMPAAGATPAASTPNGNGASLTPVTAPPGTVANGGARPAPAGPGNPTGNGNLVGNGNPPVPALSRNERLQGLRQEASARMKALMEKPDPNLVPHVLLQMRDDQRFAYVVDTRRSRLYVYENRQGAPWFVRDYYVSQGRLGVNKVREGDQRTPLGVYYVTSRLPRARLPDFYGSGALPISYPNEWDKLQGRSGSGIWLHGTPSDSFSRPPLSSDGCVVLTNPDLAQLAETAEVGKTPVIISDDIRFIARAKLESERMLARQLVDFWRRDLESGDTARLKRHYSARFRSENGNLDEWLERLHKTRQDRHSHAGLLKNSSFFLYPGHKDLIVATFTHQTGQGKQAQLTRQRQYWAREGSHWRIVAETNWQSPTAS